MKRTINAVLVAMALAVTLGFVSCESYTEEPAPEKKEKLTDVYYGYLSPDCLEYLDVTLTLHSGNETKTITLKKENGTKDVAVTDFGALGSITYNVFGYLYAGFDSAEGIDRVDANVAPKADILDKLKAADPESSIEFTAGARIVGQPYRKDGKYEAPDVKPVQFHVAGSPVSVIKSQTIGGVTYEHLYESFMDRIKNALEVK